MTLKLTDRFLDDEVIIGDSLVKMYLRHLRAENPETRDQAFEEALVAVELEDTSKASRILYPFQLTLEEV